MTAETHHQQDGHCNGAALELESLDLDRMRGSRASARERLERALGPDLTQLLLTALMQDGENVPAGEPLRGDNAA